MAGDRDALFHLSWLLEAGADEAVLETPVDRFAGTTAPHPAAEGPSARPRPPPEPARIPAQAGDPIGLAAQVAAKCATLDELEAALQRFDGCPLKANAKTTVFADGVRGAKILCIGEAPGAEEDQTGKPFVGRAGQLLDRMLAAIGLSRQENVYITNVLNWRPPANRTPTAEEAAICLPFLRRHIELAAPELIILLGATAVRHVSGRTDGILRLRGSWLDYFVAGKMVPAMPTLHPAYLLRQPAQKRLAWRDLQEIRRRLAPPGLSAQA